MGICSISLVMNGIKKCSGGCLYCSAAKSMDYRGDDNKNTFVFDKKKTRERILEYCDKQLKQDKNDNRLTELNVDIWGGNPVENFDQFKEVVSFLQNDLKEFNKVSMHTSGNGLELQSEDICDFLIKNNIHYQLSHDGCGQWLRTGTIDPLYWEKTRDNIVKLVSLGILDWINCTLSARNYSFFENINYFNTWRQNFKIYDKFINIKLNHIYPGTAIVDKVWLFDDNKYIKKGETIGDLNLTGKILQEYLHEFRKLVLFLSTGDVKNSNDFKCYSNYILSQADRFNYKVQENTSGSSCVDFQRGTSKVNFAIDTKGEYCQCNLIDSDHTVLNKTAKQPEYCKTCKYKNLMECNPCGSENPPEKCEYHWYWAETLEELFQLRELINYYETAKNVENHQCDCHKDSDDAVYCVRNYKIK